MNSLTSSSFKHNSGKCCPLEVLRQYCSPIAVCVYVRCGATQQHSLSILPDRQRSISLTVEDAFDVERPVPQGGGLSPFQAEAQPSRGLLQLHPHGSVWAQLHPHGSVWAQLHPWRRPAQGSGEKDNLRIKLI